MSNTNSIDGVLTERLSAGSPAILSKLLWNSIVAHMLSFIFSKYLKTFNYKIKKIQAGGRMLDIIGFQVMLRQTGNYNKYSYMTNTTYRSATGILSICKYTINNISNSITSIRTCLVNTDIADHITSILHSKRNEYKGIDNIE